MTTLTVREEVAAAARRLRARIMAPRALTIREDDRVAIGQAIERVGLQLLGEADAVLTIALAGCSGVGKSTMINALAGSTIAEAAERRPCTMQARAYHHRDVPRGGLPADLASAVAFESHDRPELRFKVIVDTPDLDTFATENRAATRAMLKAAGLVLYVFSPERYVEERAWSVIREEERFSACLAVLNKSDTVPAPVLEQITGELRHRFAEMGHPEVKVLRVASGRHVPRADAGPPPLAPDAIDEFRSLRAYIEHELQDGDIATLIRQQRARVVDHLRGLIEGAIGRDLDEGLETLDREAAARSEGLSRALAEELSGRLAAVEAELAPLATMRLHQRFWGPFRLWLSLTDFLTYGLPRVIRRLRFFAPNEPRVVIEEILSTGLVDRVGDLLRDESRKLQDVCYAAHLPVDRWRAITTEARGDALLAEVARRITAQFEASAASGFAAGRLMPGAISLVGAVVPAGAAIVGLSILFRNMASGRIDGGFAVLGLVVALTLLLDATLHALVGLFASGRRAFSGRGVGQQVLREVVGRTVRGWVAAYRADVEADLLDLREPLITFQNALDAPRIVGPLTEPSAPSALPASLDPGPIAPPEPEPRPEPGPRPGPEAEPVDPAQLLLQRIKARTRS